MTLELKEKAIEEAYKLVVYEESEQADLKDVENKFDAIWQSIYDFCNLVKFDIIEDITDDELNEGLTWLKKYQALTKNYQDISLDK